MRHLRAALAIAIAATTFGAVPTATPAGAATAGPGATPVAAPAAAPAATPAATPAVAGARARYTPTPGPVFANRNRAIFNLLIRNINNAPRGSTIRAMTMTFSDDSISWALIRAAARGVNVKVAVANKACQEPAVARLRAWGWNPFRGNSLSVRCVKHGGRGSAGTQHIKGMSFSRTGTRTGVVVLTSSNFTKTAPTKQWNDAYQSVGWTKFYRFWNGIHREVMADRPIRKPFREMVDGISRAYVTPQNPGQADPVVQRIRNLPTRGLTIHIAQSAEHSARGKAIVDALIAKRRAGASVTYVFARPAQHSGALRAAGVRVKKVDPPAADEFLHHKFMIASWINDRGHRVYRTWTGTEVWTDLAKHSDEMMLQLASKKTYKKYRAQIGYLLSL